MAKKSLCKNDKSSIIKMMFLFFIIFSTSNLTAQTIRINEVVSSNSQNEDEDGDTPDWLELHNYGTETVSINNWSLSDDENDLTQWVFPDIALAPDQYVLIWASSKDRSTTIGNLHTNFKISSSSETVFLIDASGTIVDQLFAENLPPDTSIGVSKNSGDLVNYLETTPGNENSDNEFIGFVESEIIFSNEGGLVNGPVTLMLSGNAAGEDIRYTVDGEMPTETSTLYSGPIQINANTSVKAQLFLANYIPSEVFTRSYIVNANHEIDVMLLTADPADLFDEETGIYVFGPNDYETVFPFKGANFWEDWERPIHFAFYEKEGNRSVEFNAGVKIFGGVSRGNAQKSLSLFARGQYGDSEFEYPFFDELSYNTFESLVLRNSGTDWLESSMKDMMTTSLMRGTDLDFQEHTPVATYINGEYWGKYNLREKINEHMLASKHNVDADDITILEINGAIIEGSNAEYFDLQRYISTTDLTDDSNFERVAEEIDLKEFALYQATEIYINNTDWLTNNIKYWKHPEGKWRWILFDTDRGFEGLTNNTLAFATADNGKEWTTLFLKKLLTNIGFRNMFINRYADELNTRFLPSIVNAHIDEIYNSIQPEINASYLRWDKDPARALVYINGIKNFANNRPPIAKEHIKSQFNLPAYHPIIITNPELSQGSVEVNSNLNIQEAFWTGDYFETVPIELKAMPKAGFEFSHWSGDIASTEQTLSLTLVGQIEVTPNFAPTNSNDPIVINEINYKSSATFDTDDWVELYNPNTTPIDISNWQLKDNNDANTFTIPGGTTIDADGYIVLVKTAADFTAVYPEITNIIGDIGFGFGGSDAVRLFDADGSLQDEVVYQSAAPWSDCADETGNTLELISADLDNALPESWSCINTNGSPNAQNSVTQPSALVINEINYKSSASFDADDWVELYNPNTTSIDLSDWQLKDDNDLNSYAIPSGTTIDADGYIVIVKTASDFTSVYPDVTNFIGDIGFGFGGSDAVRLFDANGSLQDEVIYQSGAPWSDCADETGNTLELISADLDNALPDSWSCINTNGSPNAKNGSPVIETCPSSQIVLSTQQEVDTFSSTYDIANCTFDQGIKIAGDDITNLNGLSVLQTVNGSFDISDNTTLNDISGLSALITVNGDLQIYNNATLDNLSGLSSLSSVGGNVFISRNAALLDLSGLSAMSTVGGGLNISNNTILSNCDIVLICDETVVVDDINIYGNAGNCIDLATAEAACTFTALICPSDEVVLTTQQEVDDFSSIYDVANCTFDQGITIEGADITNLNGLSGLTEVNGSLEISNNPILTDISGLSSLSTVGGNLSISTNVSLENLNGLALLTTVGGNMLLNKNTVLTDLISLAQLTSVSGGLNISKNPVLSNCEIALVCDATAVTGDSNIYSNAGDCVDLATAEGACFGGEPVVDAGENQIIVLPITSSAIFNGTANDPDDGTIVSFEWTQTDGPDTAILSGENTATLEVTGLIAGSYIFMLTVTDDQNETGFDEVVLQVQSGGFTPPVVNAGLDQNSTETSITLNGNGSDPDGGEVVFLWTQEDGPSTANLAGSDTAELTATNLIIGEYLFKLTVTDDENETSFDEVTVTITDENPVLTCPTSQVVLTTQQEVDDFSSIYDAVNCTFDDGISVEGVDISNLNGLSGLQVVNGRLEISNNPILTDISGLSSLSTVGQNLTISTNVSLENLNSLALLTTVGGNMLVNKNTVLTDLIGLAQLTNVAGGINISKNPVLSNCEIALVCDATVVAGDTSIYSNTGNCVDLAAAEAACSIEPEQRPFITTWKTDNEGESNDNQITIPGDSWESYAYNYNVEWGDGTSNIGVTGTIIHTYDFPGTYQVSITGDYPKISFGAVNDDKNKIIYINQWGDIEWETMEVAFNRCENLDVLALDTPDLSKVESIFGMFADCESLVGNSSFNSWDVSNVEDMMILFVDSPFNQDISDWDVRNVKDMSYMFQGAYFNQDISTWDVSGVENMSAMFLLSKAFNQDISAWDVSNVTEMSIMFSRTLAFNQDLSAWDVSNVTTLRDIFSDSKMTTENYDKTLQGWSNLPNLKNSVALGAANIRYCEAEEARQKLIDDFGWVITDAGKADDCDDPVLTCPSDLVVLTTQQEVDAFATTYDVANCTFEGGISIEGTDIVNLVRLSALTTVSGPLSIVNTGLINLQGLSSLMNMGDVLIDNNSVLTSLDGLSSITSAGTLTISNNELLTSLDGLSSITSAGNLIIQNNTSLPNLDGLSSLESISDDFKILNNASLLHIDGLSSFVFIDNDLIIESNPMLENLDGLSSLDAVGLSLSIQSNDALTNLDGLSAITNMFANLLIINNDFLTNLNGLANLNNVGGDFNISGNNALSDCAIAAVCDSDIIVNGNLIITENTGNCGDVAVAKAACANGIWLEAECAIVGSDWSLINDGSASEGKYILAPIGRNLAAAPTNVNQHVTFAFQADAGAYSLHALVQAGNGADDSFWVRANGGTWIRWNKITNSPVFVWDQLHDSDNGSQAVTFNLVQGSNTIDIALREDGAALDKIYITSTSDLPTGFGDTANNCVFVSEPPTADAGTDMTIMLPTDSVVLSGTGTDPDGGAIETYAWTQENGGTSIATLAGETTPQLTASDLVEGTYVFRLTVTDDESESAFDLVSVVVEGIVELPPTADAGTDQNIILPTDSVVLTGTGTDPDGGAIETYAWTQENGGPTTATLAGEDTPQLSASNLVEGTYVFRLTVTDDEGDTDFDDVSVEVSPETPQNIETIWLEAECGDVGSAWSVLDNGSASNGQYIVGLAGSNVSSPPTDTSQLISFDFQADAGSYSIHVLAHASSGSDSFWVRANGGTWIRWNGITRSSSFLWDQVHDSDNSSQSVAFDLVSGTNTIDIAIREDGTELDKIYVTSTSNLPTGVGEDASNCVVVPEPPIADAGSNQNIVLPTNSVVLTGGGNDPDGGAITGYLWTLESGPSPAMLSGSNSNELIVENLFEGTYIFRLTVTDDEDDTGFDEVSIEVSPETPQSIDTIWLEAECGAIGSAWSVLDNGSASNGQFIVGLDGSNISSPPTDTSQLVSFNFQADAGSFSIHALAHASSGSDSFWLRANGGTWIRWNGVTRSSGFVWDQVHNSDNSSQPVIFDLVSGTNTIDIAIREDGTELDKIYVTSTSNLPAGLGGNASNCSSGVNIFAKSFSEPNQMILFPNPAKEATVLSFEEPAGIRIIYVYDVLGRLLQTISAEEVQLEENYSMDMRGLPSGTYFVKTYDDNGIPYQQQMIIER